MTPIGYAQARAVFFGFAGPSLAPRTSPAAFPERRQPLLVCSPLAISRDPALGAPCGEADGALGQGSSLGNPARYWERMCKGLNVHRVPVGGRALIRRVDVDHPILNERNDIYDVTADPLDTTHLFGQRGDPFQDRIRHGHHGVYVGSTTRRCGGKPVIAEPTTLLPATVLDPDSRAADRRCLQQQEHIHSVVVHGSAEERADGDFDVARVRRQPTAQHLEPTHVERALTDGLPEQAPRPEIHHSDLGWLLARVDRFDGYGAGAAAQVVEAHVSREADGLDDLRGKTPLTSLVSNRRNHPRFHHPPPWAEPSSNVAMAASSRDVFPCFSVARASFRTLLKAASDSFTR
jgi:hypothetical protein